MATSLRTKRRIFDLNQIILSMLNKASNFDHKQDISFSPTQYLSRELNEKKREIDVTHLCVHVYVNQFRIVIYRFTWSRLRYINEHLC